MVRAALRILKPDTADDVRDAVRDAAQNATALAVEGNGSKQGLGRLVETDTTLKLSGLTGITMYEPDEMVVSARAGTTLEEIEATLYARGQCLGFEPGEIGPLWSANAKATIGGTIAAAINGPRRFAAGAARDHLLGFSAVNGKGEPFKAGGRVVKNVTGYDLPKLAAGSFGTLFVMTELTLRAVPRGAAATVLAIECLTPADALLLLRTVARSPFEPSGLAYLPADASSRAGGRSQSQTLIRLEGQAEGVKAREAELMRTWAKGARVLETKLFRALADVHTLFNADLPLFRLSIPPSRASEAIDKLSPTSWFADGAGAILWFAFEQLDAHDIERVHQAARALGGHATLYRAPNALRERDVFPPLDDATLALTRQIKHAFDPAKILNPARMYKDV
jgi:glycolate oxidase FAD binding subunit